MKHNKGFLEKVTFISILMCVTLNVWGGESTWLAVTREMFTDALKPLAEHRETQGFKAVISSKPIPEAIEEAGKDLKYILIVGDYQKKKSNESWYMPSNQRILYRWTKGQKEIFESDMLFGDRNGDLIPDIPVGRIPARDTEKLNNVITGILEYEKQPPSLNDMSVVVWAGDPCYTETINKMSSGLLKMVLNTKLPLWVRANVITADTSDPLCGYPPMQPSLFNMVFKKGVGLAILVGHGMEDHFYALDYNQRRVGYSHGNITNLGDKPLAPLVFSTCYGGKFSMVRESLGEAMLLQPGGPVAVIGATSESQPLMNGYMCICMAEEFDKGGYRLGSQFLHVQRKAYGYTNLIMEHFLTEAEGKLDQEMNIPKLRRDQILMYTILGDPATLIKRPSKLSAKTFVENGVLKWSAEKPENRGRLYVTFRKKMPVIPKIPGDGGKLNRLKLYQDADSFYAFTTLSEHAYEEEWQGVVDQEGTLRLVVLNEKHSYVYSVKVNPPKK